MREAQFFWCKTRPTAINFGMETHVGEGRVCNEQPSPYPKGVGTNCSPDLGFPTYAYTIWRRTTKFGTAR